jgi:hypothetical protein
MFEKHNKLKEKIHHFVIKSLIKLEGRVKNWIHFI